jgi:DNA-directed RNA polymerase specialized sigma24 family protein
MSEAQVAAELGLRPGTVKSTTARALAKLRQDSELRAEAPR